jgi:hypothetical protein
MAKKDTIKIGIICIVLILLLILIIVIFDNYLSERNNRLYPSRDYESIKNNQFYLISDNGTIRVYYPNLSFEREVNGIIGDKNGK